MPKLSKSFQLVMGLLDRDIAHTGPFYVNIDVSQRCNIRCLGCQYFSSKTRGRTPIDANVKELSLELVHSLCRELPRLGTKNIVLTGAGEPFLHPQLFDIISAFKRSGFTVELFTNGTLLDESNARLVLESGTDLLVVSLWANSPEEYAKCHPGISAQNFKIILNGLKVISALKIKEKTNSPRVFLHQVNNRYNFKSIEKKFLWQELTAAMVLSFRHLHIGVMSFCRWPYRKEK
jgi:MoaA/NifB/PqqE/SkfB family radical SAM enzyme